jgi:hypothetical protein
MFEKPGNGCFIPAVKHPLADPPSDDQPGMLQNRQMGGDGGL